MSADPVIAQDLRDWAGGSYSHQAAVELLIRSFHGRFAGPGYPWIEQLPSDQWALDPSTISPETTGALSGGERRVLAVVAHLAGGWDVVSGLAPLDLGDVASGVDRAHLALILAAIAHAGGSHEHAGLRFDDEGRPTGLVRLPSLYPWPEAGEDL